MADSHNIYGCSRNWLSLSKIPCMVDQGIQLIFSGNSRCQIMNPQRSTSIEIFWLIVIEALETNVEKLLHLFFSRFAGPKSVCYLLDRQSQKVADSTTY